MGSFECENIFVSVLAFMDDTYLVARNFFETPVMLDDLVAEFAKWGLTLSPGKLKVMSENCDSDDEESSVLWFDGDAVEKVTELKVLGGKRRQDNVSRR